MRTSSRRLSFALLTALVAACSEGPGPLRDPTDPGQPGATHVPAPRGPQRPEAVPPSAVDCGRGSGALTGTVVAPNGSTPVAGAFVHLASGDCWVGTGREGRFSVRGLPGETTLVRMEKGLFRSELDAMPGGSVTLRVNGSQVRLAFVRGAYDNIERVLERLGFAAEGLEAEQLATADLSGYSALFLNCGLDDSYAYDDATVEALRAFVQGGGALYASDWAESYVQRAFPGRVHFLAGAARVGESGEAEARVLDEGMKRALGREGAQLLFDQSGWAVIDSVPAATEVLVSGPAATPEGTLANRPYVVQFTEGGGRVSYTSFHNEAQTTRDMDILLEQLLFQL